MLGSRHSWHTLPFCLALLALLPGCGGQSSSDTGPGSGGTSTGGGGGGGGCGGTQPICFGICGGEGSPEALVCSNGKWECPPGTKSLEECIQCPDPPQHVCCDAQGTHAAVCPGGEPMCAAGQTLADISSGCQPGCETTGCGASQYCRFLNNACSTGMTGQCVDRPSTCAPDDAPVCGCDGNVYANACEAAKAGVGLGKSCKLSSDQMQCGTRICRIGSEYCRVTEKSGAFSQYDCVPVPASCGTLPDCSCLASEPCAQDWSHADPPCMDGSGPGTPTITCYVQ